MVCGFCQTTNGRSTHLDDDMKDFFKTLDSLKEQYLELRNKFQNVSLENVLLKNQRNKQQIAIGQKLPKPEPGVMITEPFVSNDDENDMQCGQKHDSKDNFLFALEESSENEVSPLSSQDLLKNQRKNQRIRECHELPKIKPGALETEPLFFDDDDDEDDMQCGQKHDSKDGSLVASEESSENEVEPLTTLDDNASGDRNFFPFRRNISPRDSTSSVFNNSSHFSSRQKFIETTPENRRHEDNDETLCEELHNATPEKIYFDKIANEGNMILTEDHTTKSVKPYLTPTGFWDIGFPPTAKTQEASPSDKLRKRYHKKPYLPRSPRS